MMKQIPYALAHDRFNQACQDVLEALDQYFALPMIPLPKKLYKQVTNLQECFRWSEDMVGWREARVYNAVRMFQDCGNYSELVDIIPDFDWASGRVLASAEQVLSFDDGFEKKWFACCMCGKESQLYISKNSSKYNTRQVREFMEQSHICDQCWQEYVYGDKPCKE